MVLCFSYGRDRPETDRADRKVVPGIVFASLSTFAGAVDVCALHQLDDVYASFMSGNTVLFGKALADGDAKRSALLAAVLSLFVVGAMIGSIFSTLVGRMAAAAVLFVTAVVLAIPAAYPPAGALAMTFSMGLLNASMDRVGSQSVGLTYVTGALVKFASNCGRLVCGRKRDLAFAIPSLAWIGLLLGSAIATLALRADPALAVSLLPAGATLLALACWIAGLDDPELAA